MSSRRDQEWWARSGASAARNPAAWLLSAEQLKRAADAVLQLVQDDWASLANAFSRTLAGVQPPPPPVAAQYMMLAGFAAENLAKGLILLREPRRVQPNVKNPGRLLRWEGSGHLLARLLDQTGEELSGAERELLSRFETFINWAGRYPVALRAMEMAHAPGADGPTRMSSDDVAVFEKLYERLHARLLHEATEAGERSEVLDREQRAMRRRELLSELTAFEPQTRDAVTVYRASGQPNQPTSAVGCATCGAGFRLAPDTPAAVCRCGVLHHYQVEYDASLGRDMPNVASYPPTEWPPWYVLNTARRRHLVLLERDDVPNGPGVYAVFHNAQAVYVGKGKSLRQRVWSNHCGKGQSLTSSAFRRNVAEHLGIASANAIKTGLHRPTPEEVRRVRKWVEACDVAWVTTATEAEAIAVERAVKRQWRPPLTKA